MTATNQTNTALQVLFGYIPTEVLTIYVAVVAALHPSPSGAAAIGTKAFQEATKVTFADWAVFYIFLGVVSMALGLLAPLFQNKLGT